MVQQNKCVVNEVFAPTMCLLIPFPGLSLCCVATLKVSLSCFTSAVDHWRNFFLLKTHCALQMALQADIFVLGPLTSDSSICTYFALKEPPCVFLFATNQVMIRRKNPWILSYCKYILSCHCISVGRMTQQYTRG